MKTTTMKLLMLAASVATFGSVLAGSLDPLGAPAPTMVTLQQLYERLHPASDTCFDYGGNRFVDCATAIGGVGTSNGTVKDTQTGLIWLKNANCFGGQDWPNANIKAAQLSNGQCGLTDGSKAGDWRLPTQAEWTALVKASCFDGSNATLPNKSGAGCYATGPWATGVQANFYWSSSPAANLSTDAGYAYLFDGSIFHQGRTFGSFVWPVRGGQ